MDDEYVIKLDRRNLNAELRGLLAEDEEFRQIAGTYVGRDAARKRDARIAELEAELATAQRASMESILKNTPREELDKRFREDPEFARAYTDYQHTPAPDPQEARGQAEFNSGMQEWLEAAALEGIPPERLDAYAGAVSNCMRCQTDDHSTYDHDPRQGWALVTGSNETPQRQREIRANNFQHMLTSEVNLLREERNAQQQRGAPPQPPQAQEQPAAQATPSAQQPQQQPPQQQQAPPAPAAQTPAPTPPQSPPAAPGDPGIGTPNPALQRSAPDTSEGGGVAGAGEPLTIDAYRAMTPPERLALFPEQGDFEKAVEAGRVIVPGVNDQK
jgi:hypothetical protein